MRKRDSLLTIVFVVLALLISPVLTPGALAEERGNEAEVEAAIAVQGKHQASLMSRPEVNAVGVGLMEDGKRVGIVIFVRKDLPMPSLPTHLDGVPVRVIESGPVVAHHGGLTCGFPCHAGAFLLPVPTGVSMGNPNGNFAGTMGFRVHVKGDKDFVGFITNNHVGAASGVDLCPAQLNPANLPAFGLNQCQPGLLDEIGGTCLAPVIGNLIGVVPIIMGGEWPNTIDAAFVQSNRGCVSKKILDIGSPVKKALKPKLGDKLVLSGRTSGKIKIKVVAVNIAVLVGYGACGSALFVGQVATEPRGTNAFAASLPGDSGAPVVKVVEGKKHPVGLNFAGNGFNGFFNPIKTVLEALSIQIDTQKNDPPAAICN